MAAALGIAQVGLGLFGLSNANNEADALKARGEYQQKIFNDNADQLDRQAGEVERVGEEDAAAYVGAGRAVVGKQQASYAGQGVDVGTGVARDVSAETTAKSIQDMLTIRSNAWRTSFGLRQEGNNLRKQGAFARMGGNAAAGSTLATGGLNFVNNLGGAYKYFKDA